MDFHQERAPTLLDQLGFGRTLFHFHAALGIDVHSNQAMAVENFLDLENGRGAGELARFGGGKGLAEELQGFDQPRDLSRERLALDAGYDRKFLGGDSYGKQQGE